MFLNANEERFFFQLQSAADAEQFSLLRLEGAEEISSLFEFAIEVVSADGDIDFSTLIGQSAFVTLLDQTDSASFDLNSESVRHIHGMVARVSLGEQGLHQSSYHITLVPRLWMLKHRKNSRIFQHQNIQQIIDTILAEAGLNADEFRFDLSKSYPEYDYCVQYRETELDFIQRLLAEEGIHYYFEHSEESHVAILSDASISNPAISGDPQLDCYHDSQGAVREQHIFNFSYRESVVPGKVTLRDFNFKKPSLKLESAKAAELDIPLEVYNYPGRFMDTRQGANNATILLESLNSYRQSAKGQSDVNRMTPGYSFELTGHDRDELNAEYLIARVEHECSQPQVLEAGSTTEGSQYSNKYLCTPFTVPFRPDTDINYPRVKGTQTATVTGPEGEEIYTDEHGRIKVQFHWDREGQGNETSSCWIRVSQAHAGGSFGGMFIPRIGEEVIVDFLEGDPDKPLIIGRVYHGLNRPPYKLPEHKTRSTIKTNSTKGGDGFNEIRFEDKKGEEQVFHHVEKDLDQRTKNDQRSWLGNDRHKIVEGKVYSECHSNEHHLTQGDQFQQVNKDQHLTIGESQFTAIAEKLMQYAGSQIHYKAGNQIIIDVGTELTLKAGSGLIKLDPSGVTITGADLKLNEGGSGARASKAGPTQPQRPLEADNSLAGFVSDPKQAEIIQMPLPLDFTDKKDEVRFKIAPVPGAKGYANEPYKLYRDGGLIAEGLTDEKGYIKAPHVEGTGKYSVELISGHRFDIDVIEKYSEGVQGKLERIANQGYRTEKGDNADDSVARIAHWQADKGQTVTGKLEDKE
ncbi:type VI secretion system Vgr family protein [Amphritea japonica]|uniref:Type VI secretion system secreted protein VgrG n=1 Tax=Amphritea japonica ATCC BAA-1530 TaxID=1278309 RepID=A0A7R6P0Q6_9GAMM|nr:type VI secretion system tip protein VgrG [Amphritea japonica]BBB24993.1 type VI secretion system secreted protein VgrG [Amphritea japonica ATCC BAA-1530]